MQDIISFILFLIIVAARVLKIMVIAYVILSWIPLRLNKVREFIWVVLGPIFNFVRKYSPRFGMIDLSPIFVFILIDLFQQVLLMLGRSLLTV